MTSAHIAPSFKNIAAGLVGLALALTCFFAATPRAHAAGLTEAQIGAVTGLLSAFDVPQATIDNVDAILRGQSEGKVSAAPMMPAQHLSYVPPQPPHAPAAAPAYPAPGMAPSQDASSLVAAVAMVPMTTTADSLNILADQIVEINYAVANVLSSYIALFTPDIPHAAAAVTALPSPEPVVQGESLAATLAYLPQSTYETMAGVTQALAAVEMAPVYVITQDLSDALYKAGLY